MHFSLAGALKNRVTILLNCKSSNLKLFLLNFSLTNRFTTALKAHKTVRPGQVIDVPLIQTGHAWRAPSGWNLLLFLTFRVVYGVCDWMESPESVSELLTVLLHHFSEHSGITSKRTIRPCPSHKHIIPLHTYTLSAGERLLVAESPVRQKDFVA